MKLKCLVGMHDWNGCKCRGCDKTRDTDHDWFSDCEKCATCGQTRSGGHQWKACKCSICGQLRNDFHDWEHCRCRICGKQRDEEHAWEHCRCRICGRHRNEEHRWIDGKCSLCGEFSFDLEQLQKRRLLLDAITFLKNKDYPAASASLDSYSSLQRGSHDLVHRIRRLDTLGGLLAIVGRTGGVAIVWDLIKAMRAEVDSMNPAVWEEIHSKYSTCISGNPEDERTYDVRLHTFYQDQSHANRVLSGISNEVAGILRPTNEGPSSLTGAPRYHATHEGRLTGAQVKEYLITVVTGGGEMYEVFL